MREQRRRSVGAVKNRALFANQSPLSSPSNRLKQRRDSNPLASTGNILTRSSVTLERDPESLRYDTTRGVTSGDLARRKKQLWDLPEKGQWMQCDRNLPPGVSETLEKAYLAGELKCGVWDNGLFRDFDLAKMQEIPGLKELRRVAPKQKNAGLEAAVQRTGGKAQMLGS